MKKFGMLFIVLILTGCATINNAKVTNMYVKPPTDHDSSRCFITFKNDNKDITLEASRKFCETLTVGNTVNVTYDGLFVVSVE